jgi:RTX calcium-binding nonapeptide repeat (4 copies)
MLQRAWMACAAACVVASCTQEVSPVDVAGKLRALTVSDCPTGYNIIQGTNGSETLTGTAGNDCIVARNGNDTLLGGGGNDFLIGGDGNDTLRGEGGQDVLHGEAGIDALEGGDDNDTLFGGTSADTLYGQNGDDTLSGEGAGDTLEGGPGRDFLRGNEGDDILRGGDGDDRIHGEAGADRLYGDLGADVLFGGVNADRAWGGDGDDVIHGGDGNDEAYGEAGDDALIGGAGSNTANGGPGTDACTGTSCEKAALVPTGCTQDSQCSGGARCIADFGLCLSCVSDQDGDGTCDSADACLLDPNKSAPGVCGCGVSDVDGDGDATPDCTDGCPSDASKTSAGICGCGVSDADGDGDGTSDCNDGCPSDADKSQPGVCGCGVSDADGDSDGSTDCIDGCPSDPGKTNAGVCGCGVSDVDSDGDGSADCIDGCPSDSSKTSTGVCGCGISDVDSDGDGVADCVDACAGWDDTVDADDNGAPDACEIPITCSPGLQNRYVWSGDAVVQSSGDIATLAEMRCVDGSLYVSGTALADLIGLENLIGITGHVYVEYNPALASLSGLDGLQTIGGDARIAGNSALTELGGLSSLSHIGGRLELFNNLALANVDGLDAVTQIDGALVIQANAGLEDLAGLANLESVGVLASGEVRLMIANNPRLPGCWAWTLQHQLGVPCGDPNAPSLCSGNAGTGSCGTLPPDFECVPGAQGPGVYDGYVSIYPGNPSSIQLDELGGVTCITQGLMISGSSEVDLSALNNLQHIGGSFALSDNESLATLTGLENLETIRGSLYLWSNDTLASLGALANLDVIGTDLPPESGRLMVQQNASLSACEVWALEARTGVRCGQQDPWTGPSPCRGNTGQASCGALPPDFECAPGAQGPGVYDGYLSIYSGNPSSIQLDELGGVTCITQGVMISGSSEVDLTALNDLQFVGGSLALSENESLATLTGLENLESIRGSLYLWGNDTLASLGALSNLDEIGTDLPPESARLMVQQNASLSGCEVWALEARTGVECGQQDPWIGFSPCRGNTGQASCGTLPPDFECVPGAQGPGVYDGYLSIYSGNPSSIQLDELGGVTCITQGIMISGSSEVDLTALAHLQHVGGSLALSDNELLTTLQGLENLESIRGSLYLWGNDALGSIGALSNLDEIGTDLPPESSRLMVQQNASLSGCEVWAVEARTGVACGQQDPWIGISPCRGNTGQASCGTLPPDFECVPGAQGPGVYDGYLSIYSGNPSSIQLDELGGVTCITQGVMISGSSEVDLTALAHLQHVGGSLALSDNELLTTLHGLENLESIRGSLYLWGNDTLGSIGALSILAELGTDLPPDSSRMVIEGNPSLSACELWTLEDQTGVACGEQTWEGFRPCAGNRGQATCGTLPPDFECVPGAEGPGVFDGHVTIGAVGFGPGRRLDELGGVTCITGTFSIVDTDTTDFNLVPGLRMVGGSLFISSSAALQSLSGLENLEFVGEQLQLYYNPILPSLAPLSSLVSLGTRIPPSVSMGSLHIEGNASLPECWVSELETQTNSLCESFDGIDWHDCSGNDGTGTCD